MRGAVGRETRVPKLATLVAAYAVLWCWSPCPCRAEDPPAPAPAPAHQAAPVKIRPELRALVDRIGDRITDRALADRVAYMQQQMQRPTPASMDARAFLQQREDLARDAGTVLMRGVRSLAGDWADRVLDDITDDELGASVTGPAPHPSRGGVSFGVTHWLPQMRWRLLTGNVWMNCSLTANGTVDVSLAPPKPHHVWDVTAGYDVRHRTVNFAWRSRF